MNSGRSSRLRASCARPATLLLLDDVLAVLSYDRQERMLDRIRQLAQSGVAVIDRQ